MGTSPALASDGSNSSPSVSSTQEVQPEGLVNGPNGSDGQCTQDICKRIPWCDSTNGAVSNDSPYVALSKGDGAPRCVQKPHVSKVTCCEDGVGNVIVWVHNPNTFKLKVGVTIDGGTPEVMWVKPGETAEYKFDHIANGNHVIRASVWVKDNVWCNFAKLKLCVECTSPSPSHSPSHSPTPSSSPSASHSASPTPSHSHSASPTPSESHSAGVLPPINHTGNSLPITGAPTAMIAGVGLFLVGGGFLALVLSRRRKATAVIAE